VFWAKEPAKIEFINDSNGEVINFYRVLKFRFPELKKEIDAMPSDLRCIPIWRIVWVNVA
jgi:site-specific DNA-adenine methylase